MALPPYLISWNLPSGSKYIRRSFKPNASNTFRSFLPYSKQLARFHGNIAAFVSFLPYSILHALVAIVTSAKDCMWSNDSNPTVKTISNYCCTRLKIVHPTNNFEPQPILKGWRYGIKYYCIEVPLTGIRLPPYQISWKYTKRFESY
jgi:hypothetical protein